MEDTAIFRPAKRRKFARQHGAKNEAEADLLQADQSPTQVASEQDSEPGVSSILKLRRQQRSRVGGVQFSTAKPQSMAEDSLSTALVPAENPTDGLKAMNDRFVGLSGQVVDVDKHMCVPQTKKPDSTR